MSAGSGTSSFVEVNVDTLLFHSLVSQLEKFVGAWQLVLLKIPFGPVGPYYMKLFYLPQL